tara:strand:+ start:791 stop:1330 length:540 start_codon:yes stop_codon:yes gene_type:complete
MAEYATIARPYANAAFAVAKSEDDLRHWSGALDVLVAASADTKVRVMLESPEISKEEKAAQLCNLCGDELNKRTKQFVKVLAQNKRLDLLSEIRDQFEALSAAEEQVLDVTVTSAYPISSDEEEMLRKSLAAKYSKEVSLSAEIDKELIGGAIIRAGDTVIDGSLRGKLDKLTETLLRN